MVADETILLEVRGDADKYARELTALTRELLDLQKGEIAAKKAIADGDKARRAAAAAATVAAKARKQVQKELDAAEKASTKAMKDAAKERKEAWEGIAVLAAGAVAGFGAILNAQVDATREIDRLAGSSGLATDTIAGLRIAAIGAGLAVEDIVPQDLADRLVDLAQGTGSVVDDFELLKLSADDFKGVSLDEAFLRLVDAMDKAEDQTAAVAAASRLLGGDGEKLGGVLEGGRARLELYARAAREIGAGSTEAMDAGRRWGATLGSLSLALEEAGAEVATLTSAAGIPTLVNNFSIGLVFATNAASAAVEEFVIWIRRLADFDFAALSPTETLARIGRVFTEGYEAAEVYSSTLGLAGDAAKKTTVDVDGLAAAASKVTFDFRGAMQGLADLNRSITADLLTDEDRIQQAYHDRLLAADALVAKAREAGATEAQLRALEVEANAAVVAAGEERDRKLAALDAERVKRSKEAADAIIADNERIAEEMAERSRAATMSTLSMFEDASSGLSELLRETGGRYKGLAMAAFIAARAAAVAQAIMNTNLAVSNAIASGPPPGNFVLAGISGAAGAAQAVAVAASPVPRFHVGSRMSDLAADEMTVTRREVTAAVLTPQGVANANAGIRSRGDAGQSLTLVQIGHQVVGRAAAEAIVRPDSLLGKTIGRDVPGHARRRT